MKRNLRKIKCECCGETFDRRYMVCIDQIADVWLCLDCYESEHPEEFIDSFDKY